MQALPSHSEQPLHGSDHTLTITSVLHACRRMRRSGKGASEVERQAKRVAFYIYFNLKPDEARRHLLPPDLEALLPPDQARA